MPWSPGRWLSLEGLHQVHPSHSAHQYLRLCPSGEGESRIRKRTLTFTGQLLGAENRPGCSHVPWEPTVGQELFPLILSKRQLRLRGTEKLIILPQVTELLMWTRGC